MFTTCLNCQCVCLKSEMKANINIRWYCALKTLFESTNLITAQKRLVKDSLVSASLKASHSSLVCHWTSTKGGFRGGLRGPRPLPPFCPGNFFLVYVCRMVLRAFYLSIFSLINIVNKKRICVRSLHFKSQMAKAPRIHAVNIRLKQTGYDNVSGTTM